MKTFQLTDVEVDEISLVDRAANADCKVILFKRDTPVVDRARAALIAVQGAIARRTLPVVPTTVAACDAAIKALADGIPLVGETQRYCAALATPQGKELYAVRSELARQQVNPAHASRKNL